jgi:RecA-family ATPase
MSDDHPERNPILTAAYDYINEKQWTILAVGNDKRPLGSWGYGGKNRYDYTNSDQIWLLGHPPAIAVVTGPSNLVVIDLDNEDAIRAWAERFGTPTTLIAGTPRGRHLYYSAPAGLHIPPGTEILPGVDVRGGESYTILPPSILAAPYKWLNNNPIQPLPDPVTKLVTTTRTLRKELILSGKPFSEGGRNDHVFNMGLSMRRAGFDYISILAALSETNKTRCVPPLDIREVEGIAKSVMRYEEDDTHAGSLIDRVRAQSATREDDEDPVLAQHAKLLETKKLVEEVPEPINWIWEDFLAPGTLNMLHGEGGLGKSYIALKIAEQVLSDTPAPIFDKPIRSGGVIILDGENAESQIHRRVQNTTIRAEAPLAAYVVTEAILGLDEYTEEYVDYLIEQHKPLLIIIDSQRALWGGDEKEAAEAGRMLRRFARHIEQHPCAFLLIHHDNRGGDYSGSSDINAAITGCRIHIKRHTDKNTPNARTITQPKNRIAQEIAHQDFLLDIQHWPVSHRFTMSGITLAPYESDEKAARIERLERAKTMSLNNKEGISYREIWASFNWEIDTKDNGLKSKHEEDWANLKSDLEAADFSVKVRGKLGGMIWKN